MDASGVDSGEAGDAPPTVRITVTRTGGVAGIRREWRAEPDEHDAPRWVELIRSCPWDGDVTVRSVGADRFTFEIHAHCGTEMRAAELGEDAVRGPWRALVDEVRNASAH